MDIDHLVEIFKLCGIKPHAFNLTFPYLVIIGICPQPFLFGKQRRLKLRIGNHAEGIQIAEIEFPAIFGFVPWRHHVEIVTKCKTIEESWSRSTLVDCIKANLYQSSGNALTNFAENLPAIQGKLAQEIVKDTYDFFAEAPSKDKQMKIYGGLFHEIFNEYCRDEVIGDVIGWIEHRTR